MKNHRNHVRVPSIRVLILALPILVLAIVMSIYFIVQTCSSPDDYIMLGIPGIYFSAALMVLTSGAFLGSILGYSRDYVVLNDDFIVITRKWTATKISWSDTKYAVYKMNRLKRYIVIGICGVSSPVIVPFSNKADELVNRHIIMQYH